MSNETPDMNRTESPAVSVATPKKSWSKPEFVEIDLRSAKNGIFTTAPEENEISTLAS